MAAFSSDSEDYSYQPGDTFKKQAKDKSIEKADTAEKTDKEQKKGKKDSKVKAAKERNDDELTLLIDMIESKPCLWNIYHPDYLKRDMKDRVQRDCHNVKHNKCFCKNEDKRLEGTVRTGDNKRKDTQERSESGRVMQKQLCPLR